jgi:hypothetical protein
VEFKAKRENVKEGIVTGAVAQPIEVVTLEGLFLDGSSVERKRKI